MRRFLTLASISMQANLQYRFAFLFNLFTPLILLAGQFLLWTALYGGQNATIGGYSRQDMYTYIIMSFLVANLLTWKSENDMSRKIISGSIVTECIRPFNFLWQNVADMCGSAVLQAGVNTLIVGALFAIFRQQLIIASLPVIGLTLISLVLAVLLRMLLISTFSLLCFYTTSFLGLSWTRGVVTDFFSGAIMPISLFPLALRTFTFYTPFPLMLQVPISIYLGQTLMYPVWMTYVLQLAWIAFFIVLQGICWGHIRKNITVAGG